MEDKSSLQKSTFSGMIWTFAERIGAQLVSTVVAIILARLLTADDYSVVSIITIFFTFANVFISSGFNSALIQKKNSDIKDFSTVLYLSVGVSIILYGVMFFCAPLIADLYSLPILIPVIRVMGLTLIVNAVKSILCAYVSCTLTFKNLFYSTFIGTVVSAVVGIVMALKGFGPWALVAQQMVNSVIGTIVLLFTTKIKFALVFSIKRLKGLFSYGWKILVSSLISVVYDEINPLIIGIKFSGADLSFYTKGKSFPSLISNTVSDTFSSVLFPVISKLQDDISSVLSYTRRFMKTASYVIFPLMLGFLAVSDNFVSVVLTEKWMPASIYIKIFCISYMLSIIQNGNLQAIRAIGRSDIILVLEIIKKTLYFAIIVCAVVFSNRPEMLAISSIINSSLAAVINTFPNRKLIGYRYRLQAADLLPNFLSALVMGAAVYAMNLLNINKALLLLLQIAAGAVIYVAISLITKNENFYYLLDFVKKFLKKGAVSHAGSN